MTSKEALKNFIKTLCEYETDTNNKESVYPCWYRIILEDLDRLEKLEKEHNKLKERYKHRAETSNDLCKAVKQYEKAIEIIKNKTVIIIALKLSKNLDDYNKMSSFEVLTQEEYKLLKEVL